MGLVKGHYFINDYTELRSYCLYNYEETKYIKDCNKIYNKFNDQYKKGNDIFIKAFQIFKVLTGKVDKLITPMELTYEALKNTIYDNVEDYKTLYHNTNNCRL